MSLTEGKKLLRQKKEVNFVFLPPSSTVKVIMEWFEGSIGDAIQSAKAKEAVFLVVVHGKLKRSTHGSSLDTAL